MRARFFAWGGGALLLAGCVGIAGIGDFEVDPCFDGCADSPTGSETSTEGGGPDGSIGNETSTDSPADGPLLSPGLSSVSTSGTGVAVGRSGVVTLVTKNGTGDVVPRTGANVVFTQSGGTSVISFGPVTDVGAGVYRATFTGVTEGTKLSVSATLDGAPLTTAPASVRVVNPVASGRTFWIDAFDADRAGNPGTKGCATAGAATWKDLGTSAFTGTLAGFSATRCGGTSGWNGDGTPGNPFRLTFDGVDDHVSFGAVNTLPKQTLIAWIRTSGPGTKARTSLGNDGLTNVMPIFSKGTAEGESDDIDINYFVGVASTGELAWDYEKAGAGNPNNASLSGTTVLAAGTWYMVALTFDSTASQRIIYLDAKQEATQAASAAPASASSGLLIVGGSRLTSDTTNTCPGNTGCGRFQGDIAIVQTYNRALSKSEIEQNCHSASSTFGMLTCPN